MPAEPREYDREFLVVVDARLRRRVGFDSERGEVTRFVVRLEYRHGEEWRPVVRYDHDGTDRSETGHDVTEDGLHIDVYRDGAKVATEFVAPPQPPGVALDFAEDHLSENMQRFVERYERWHETETG